MKKKPTTQDLYQEILRIRRVILTAVASDDVLAERLVLKGGNAIEIAHRLVARASLDLDFSIDGDLDDLADLRLRLFRALRDRFDAAGFVLFDDDIQRRPVEGSSRPPRWGGYRAEFKLVRREKYRALEGDLEAIRRDSELSGLLGNRKFTLDISRYEYCGGKVSFEIDSFKLFAYSPEMIVAEKLRAICQQTYGMRRNPAPRPRDFFDIHQIVTNLKVNLAESSMHDLIRTVFGIKVVPISLIFDIGSEREFHRQQWPSLRDSIFDGSQPEFDFYFDFVLAEVSKLQPLRDPDSPAAG